ncbi:hypothetical protein SRB5_51800 [Streptomyces sp. RB5]|uniref:Uncharacterized protein n=1 Tax=Streptomyces smaragdinus TaxID=2585196 RepID=A0A7K0CNZ1_9ACTN|nr:hypothetical protein [Streptomyces smaragdinus]MQY15003.1 hypothetical protein [Streptomyces smaragdinus]
MSWFSGSSEQPAEAFAAEEQHRAGGLASRIVAISSDPGHPSQGSLPYYREAYQDASQNAATHTSQPGR